MDRVSVLQNEESSEVGGWSVPLMCTFKNSLSLNFMFCVFCRDFFQLKKLDSEKKNHFVSVRAEKATGEHIFGYLDLMSRVRGDPAGER